MVQPHFSLVLKYMFLAFEAQQVIALRIMRVAAGNAAAERELSRMMWEKLEAATEAGFEAMLSMAGGKSSTAVVHGTVRRYRTRVRRNRRRLIRG